MPVSKLVGAKVKRREDPRLIRGLGQYVDDVNLPDMLHVAVLRTPYAHAKIKSLETDVARKHPGVVAVVTGAELKDQIGTLPVSGGNETLRVPKHYVLAVDKVCYVGEGVTAVVAEDRYTARDALDLIQVEYESLPVVSDPEKALAPGSPVIHSEWPDNVAFRSEQKQGNLTKAFKEADKIIKQRLVHQRLAPIAIEARGVVARYLADEKELTVWSSTQIPHMLKSNLAQMLKLPEDEVRVIAPEVGGGFGSKLNVYAEEGLLAYLARKLNRPVKWTEERRENFQATIHGRGQVGEVEAAVKKDGTILGLKYKVIADIGAYHQLFTPAIPPFTGLMLSGCYKIPAIGMELTAAFTNKMSTDAYRGAGRPEAAYVIERMVERIAQELKLDPVKVRRKNFPKPAEFPFKTATGLAYDSGNYDLALSKALKLAGYEKLRADQKRFRNQGRYLGIGVSTYVEICAMGPKGMWEYGKVQVEPDGKVTVLSGVSPHGQGQETSFAQIVADELGVGLDDITVIHGDTAKVPKGIGTFGSRATAVGGIAVYQSAQKVKERAREIASHLLEVDPDDLNFAEGRFSVKGVPRKGFTIQQIAQQAHLAKNLPKGMEPGLMADSQFEPSNFTFPFGTHICVVEVEPQTGKIEIKKYIAVDDCGKVINPLLVDGQIQGGIVQGLGQALFEEVIYDRNGQLVTGSLMNYALPRAADLPHLNLTRTETPTPVNPLGIKGIGEAGTIGSTPAVVNAVVDALAPFGVTHIDMPLTPQKIWSLCQETKPAGSRRARMIPAAFDYIAPESLDEALRALAAHGEEAKLLAGGHSLLPLLKLRLANPKLLIDLSKVPGLSGISQQDDKIVVGALTTHYQIESSELLKAKCPLLPQTAPTIGDVQVRNRGTIGGSLIHADPCADWPAAILALGGELKLIGPNGERRIVAEEFFVGTMTTAIEPTEILTEIRVPVSPRRCGSAYLKMAQQASGFAVVGIAVCLRLDTKGRCEDIGVGVTGLSEKPFRARTVEANLRGNKLTPKLIEESAARIADGNEPQEDLHASGQFRAHLARVYTARAIQEAAKRAVGRKA